MSADFKITGEAANTENVRRVLQIYYETSKEMDMDMRRLVPHTFLHPVH